MPNTKALLALISAVMCLTLVRVGAAASASVSTPDTKIEWLRVPDDLLSGKGINEAFDFRRQVEHVGNKDVAPDSRKVVFAGQLRTSVIQGSGDAIHLPSFPDDEVFCIIVGRLTLTSDENQGDQLFDAGDCVFVPKGWAGVWRQHAGVYREWTVVPASYSFSESIESNPPVKGARPFALAVPKQPGTHRLHAGSLIVEAENAARGSTRSMVSESDETIHIMRGNLTLKAADRSEIFKPGDFVILPKGLKTQMQESAGYQALIVRTK